MFWVSFIFDIFILLGWGKENSDAVHASAQLPQNIKSEIFAVSLRREKKKELIGQKRMKNLTATIDPNNH